MGIDISAERPQRLLAFGQRGCPQRGCVLAKLIYGCNYSDLPEEILDEVNEMLDDGSLDCASPYYDAPRGDWIVGVEVDCYGKQILDLKNHLEDDAYHHIPQILIDYDLELGFYVTPHVW